MSPIITEKYQKITISEGTKKKRIDVYLANILENATRTKVQKLIKANFVKVNGNFIKPNYLLQPGEVVELNIPVSPRPDKAEAENIPIDVVYEDEFLMVINKAAGMVVHPAFGNFTGTLVNALLGYTSELSTVNTVMRPGIVHRLDKETSGLLLVAKNDFIHSELAKQFADRTIKREYWAIVWGADLPKEGRIAGNIARSTRNRKIFEVSEKNGKPAITLYETLERFEFTSLVKINLLTGRTHQIRVHFSFLKAPVFGDPVYGGRKINSGFNLPSIKSRVSNLLELMPRQALHARKLTFFHPVMNEIISFQTELPDDFTNLIAKL